MNRLNKNILNIKYPLKKYVAGVNQLFKFDFEVNKEILDDIKIADFKINFDSLPNFNTIEDKNTEVNQNLINNNTVNLANNLLNHNLLNRNLTNIPVMPNLSAFGQQLFNQQFTNNMNNIANMNIQYLLQNNINNIALSNNNQKIPNYPNMINNINNQTNITNRTSSFTFNNYNTLLYQNALGMNQNIGIQPLPNQAVPNLIQPISASTATTTIKQVELPSPEFYIYNEEKNLLIKLKNL